MKKLMLVLALVMFVPACGKDGSKKSQAKVDGGNTMIAERQALAAEIEKAKYPCSKAGKETTTQKDCEWAKPKVERFISLGEEILKLVQSDKKVVFAKGSAEDVKITNEAYQAYLDIIKQNLKAFGVNVDGDVKEASADTKKGEKDDADDEETITEGGKLNWLVQPHDQEQNSKPAPRLKPAQNDPEYDPEYYPSSSSSTYDSGMQVTLRSENSGWQQAYNEKKEKVDLSYSALRRMGLLVTADSQALDKTWLASLTKADRLAALSEMKIYKYYLYELGQWAGQYEDFGHDPKYSEQDWQAANVRPGQYVVNTRQFVNTQTSVVKSLIDYTEKDLAVEDNEPVLTEKYEAPTIRRGSNE